jgi:hypothetical protein
MLSHLRHPNIVQYFGSETVCGHFGYSLSSTYFIIYQHLLPVYISIKPVGFM